MSDHRLHHWTDEYVADLSKRLAEAEERYKDQFEATKTLQLTLDNLRIELDAAHSVGLRQAKLLMAAEEIARAAEHIANAKSNLLMNIADTLRSRGFNKSQHIDERVIELAHAWEAAEERARAAEEAVKRYRLDWPL